MKERSYFLNILLAILWGALLAVFVVYRAFFPAAILPSLDLPLLLAVCLAALLLEHDLAPGAEHSWGVMTVLAAVTFGLLPLCAGVAVGVEAVKLAAFGGVTFLISGVLFGSMVQRISSGPSAKAAPAVAAFVLFLAGQCFTNIFF